MYAVSKGEIHEMQDIVRHQMRGGTIITKKRSSLPEDQGVGRSFHPLSLEVNVDETVGRLDVNVVFGNEDELPLLSEVTLESKYTCDKKAERQRFGNTLYFKVYCPCIGVWELRFPAGVKNWEFTAKSQGDRSIDFDIEFERYTNSSKFKEFTKQPCATEETTAWVTVYQHESLQKENRVFLHMSIDNRKYDGKTYALFRDQNNPSRFYATDVMIPEVEFMPAILGKTTLGSRFLRYQHNNIKPPSTCLTVVSTPNTIRPSGETVTAVRIQNRHTNNTYDIYCKPRQRDSEFTATVIFPESMVLEVERVKVDYYFYVKVRAPHNSRPGTFVEVSCYAISWYGGEKVQRSFPLFVSS